MSKSLHDNDAWLVHYSFHDYRNEYFAYHPLKLFCLGREVQSLDEYLYVGRARGTHPIDLPHL
jgi:hypothetical protein